MFAFLPWLFPHRIEIACVFAGRILRPMRGNRGVDCGGSGRGHTGHDVPLGGGERRGRQPRSLFRRRRSRPVAAQRLQPGGPAPDRPVAPAAIVRIISRWPGAGVPAGLLGGQPDDLRAAGACAPRRSLRCPSARTNTHTCTVLLVLLLLHTPSASFMSC